MNLKENIYKYLIKIREILVKKVYSKTNYNTYLYLYPAYIKSKFNKSKEIRYVNYLTAKPNPGAGIGHQIANWNAGYWFSKKLKLKFAHTSFSNSYVPFTKSSWDEFLGFGNDEINTNELLKSGYKLVRLPLFDEENKSQLKIIERIIEVYSNKKVVFICEQDQFYKNQIGTINSLKNKFYNNRTFKNVLNEKFFNIAIHVRRGDIVQDEYCSNENLSIRWLSNDYFFNALKNTLKIIETTKPINIYLFSQGKEEDFSEFNNFENLHFCLNESAQESFLKMCLADVLITSKSSFSYKPALLNNGIKVCPKNFWHEYPKGKEWIMLNDNGEIIERYNN